MRPLMSDTEIRLYESFLKSSDKYLEFGSGGSTCLAAGLVGTSVTAVDSVSSWLDDVAKYCAENKLKITPNLVYADIGPTIQYGCPTDRSTRPRWPNYHRGVWENPVAANSDLFLVDGRFRVACFMQIVLHAEDDAVILFHDFRLRENYQIVHEVAREIATVETLSVFLARKDCAQDRARKLLALHEFDWA